MTKSPWRKSSYSGETNGNCLEVRYGVPRAVPVRDSKNPTGPKLSIPAGSWQAFVKHVR
jgi:hypothetical protein